MNKATNPANQSNASHNLPQDHFNYSGLRERLGIRTSIFLTGTASEIDCEPSRQVKGDEVSWDRGERPEL